MTAGRTLLIEHQAKVLLEPGDHADRLRPEEPGKLKPGFADFLKTWWELQERASQDAGTVGDEPTVQAILAVLARAMGPSRCVGPAHLRRQVQRSDRIVLADSLDPIQRFAMGDGLEVEYSFSHPTLRNEVLAERISQAGPIIPRDGHPGEPEVMLAPLPCHFPHRARLEVVVAAGTGKASGFAELLGCTAGTRTAKQRQVGSQSRPAIED